MIWYHLCVSTANALDTAVLSYGIIYISTTLSMINLVKSYVCNFVCPEVTDIIRICTKLLQLLCISSLHKSQTWWLVIYSTTDKFYNRGCCVSTGHSPLDIFISPADQPTCVHIWGPSGILGPGPHRGPCWSVTSGSHPLPPCCPAPPVDGGPTGTFSGHLQGTISRIYYQKLLGAELFGGYTKVCSHFLSLHDI